MAVIVCTRDASTFTFEPPSTACRDFSGLYRIGPSRGENLTVADADGTIQRGRDRDELAVSLDRIQLIGTDRNAALTLLQQMTGFFADGSDRQFTLSLTDGSVSLSADATFEEFGRMSWPSYNICQTSMLITIHDGLLS